ncbi:MAG: HEAT repeat domain-containing protein [Planctomycetota bacterium]|nr:HEAT repeat domain-containing protein [Planctomycetota bacterium]
MAGRTGIAIALLAGLLLADEPGLAQRFRTGDWLERNRVLDALVVAPAETAVPILIEALEQEDSSLRRRAVQLLSLYGEGSSPAIPAMIQALYDENHSVRAQALTTCSELGKVVTSASLYYYEVIQEGVRPAVTMYGRGVPRQPVQPSPLDVWMKDKQWKRSGLQALPKLLKALKQEDWLLCGRAAEALGTLQAQESRVIRALESEWKRPQSFVRRKLAESLSRLGPKGAAALSRALEDPHLRKRRMAAVALAGLRKPPASAVHALRKAVATDDRTLRMAALETLRKIGAPAAPAVPELLPLLDSDDVELVSSTLDVLAQAGPQASAAVERVVLLLGDPRDGGALRKRATRTLKAVGSDAAVAVPKLTEMLLRSGRRGNGAAAALAAMGDEGRAALMRALEHENEWARSSAIGALWSSGQTSPEIYAALQKAADDPSENVRQAAHRALKAYPSKDDVGVDAVIAEIRKADDFARAGSHAYALQQKASPATIAALLGDADDKVRYAALQVTVSMKQGDFGAARAIAVENLKRAVGDEFGQIRGLAVPTLAKHGGMDGFSTLFEAALGPRKPFVYVRGIAAIGAPAVARLVDFTEHEDARHRAVAVQTLALMGDEAQAAIPALVAVLDDRALYKHASGALAGMKAVAVPALIEALRSKDRDLRRRATSTLKEIGGLALPYLRKVRNDKNQEFRKSVSWLLLELGGIEEAMASFSDKDPRIRQSAVRALARQKDGSGVAGLLLALKDQDSAVRASSARLLSGFRPHVKRIIPALVPLMGDRVEDVRRSAAHTLGSFGQASRRAIERAYSSKELNVRLAAVDALRGWGEDGVPFLQRALTSSESRVRSHAAHALRGRPAALQALMGAAGDPVSSVRSGAVSSIGSLGEAAAPAAPMLVSMLERRHNVGTVRRALVQIGGAAVPALLEGAKNGKPDTYRDVFQSLRFLAVPALIESLDDKSPKLRGTAAWALGTLGPDAQRAVPALTKALSDHRRFVDSTAAWALGEIGPGARSAVPALRKLYKEKPGVREVVADALRKIES